MSRGWQVSSKGELGTSRIFKGGLVEEESEANGQRAGSPASLLIWMRRMKQINDSWRVRAVLWLLSKCRQSHWGLGGLSQLLPGAGSNGEHKSIIYLLKKKNPHR
jgi:hypothetical protein